MHRFFITITIPKSIPHLKRAALDEHHIVRWREIPDVPFRLQPVLPSWIQLRYAR
ncbi:MAG: hypothetical protein H6573_24790 [Lewinellaceae bacterium]|nr:hypothetical protein [Lewinellaceae bacterium]